MFAKFLLGICLLAGIFVAVVGGYSFHHRELRGPVVEGFLQASEAKIKMEDYYREHGKFPSNNLEAGMKPAPRTSGGAVDDISVKGDSITITFSPEITATGTIILRAIPAKDDRFIWDCKGGTVKAEYRPPECRP